MFVGTEQSKMYKLLKTEFDSHDYDLGYAAVIRYHREEQGYTLEALSYGICSRSWLSKFENGQCRSKEDILGLILSKLEIKEEVIDLEHIHDLFDQFMRYYLFLDYKMMEEIYLEIMSYEHYFLTSFLIVEYHFIKFIYSVTVDKVEEAQRVIDFLEPLSKRVFNNQRKKLFHHIYGLFLLKRGKKDESLEQLLIAHHLPGDSNHILLYNLAGVYRMLNNIYLSLQFFEESYKEFEKENVYVRMLFCQIMIAQMYSKIGWKDRAEDLFHRVIESARHYNLDYPRNLSMFNLAIHHYDNENYEDSIKLFLLNLEGEYFYISLGYIHMYIALNSLHINRQDMYEHIRIMKQGDNWETVDTRTFFLYFAELVDYMDSKEKPDNFLEKLIFMEDHLNRNQFFSLWINVVKLLTSELESKRQYKRANFYYKKLYQAHRWEKQV
jgi:transcriptional regulator with XRE-family HTH domain